MYYCKDGNNVLNTSNVTAHISAVSKKVSVVTKVTCEMLKHNIPHISTFANIMTLVTITKLWTSQMGFHAKHNALWEGR
jgi:hypothetical protein